MPRAKSSRSSAAAGRGTAESINHSQMGSEIFAALRRRGPSGLLPSSLAPELDTDELRLNEGLQGRPALGGPATATQLGD